MATAAWSRRKMPRAPGQMRLTAEHVAPGPSRTCRIPGRNCSRAFAPRPTPTTPPMVAQMLATRARGTVLAVRLWLADLEAGNGVRREASGAGARLASALLPRLGLPLSAAAARSPGLMLALDRGGQCRGMLYRLPEETARSRTAQADPPRDEHGAVGLPAGAGSTWRPATGRCAR